MEPRPTNRELSEAQAALSAIEEAQRAALRAAVPSRGFGLTMAVCAGSLVSLAVLDQRQWGVFILLTMGVAVAYHVSRAGAVSKATPASRALLAGVALVPLFFALVVAGQLLVPIAGALPSALMAGLLLSSVLLALVALERRRLGVAAFSDTSA